MFATRGFFFFKKIHKTYSFTSKIIKHFSIIFIVFQDVCHLHTVKLMQHLSPCTLIDNLRYCYRNNLSIDQEKNPILELMVASKAIEIEFLEWTEQQENNGKEVVEKIDLMPVDVFEEYAFRFCEDTGNGEVVKRRLVKSFKRSDPGNLLTKLSMLLPYDNAYRKRNFRYVSQRYLTDKAIYKCMLLPIEADYDKFHELVTN